MTERYMEFFLLLIFGGLEMPIFASVAAGTWILLEIFLSNRDSKIYVMLRSFFYVMMIAGVIKFGLTFSKL